MLSKRGPGGGITWVVLYILLPFFLLLCSQWKKRKYNSGQKNTSWTKQLRQHAGKNKTKKTWLDIVCSAPIHSSGPVPSPAKCKCKNLLTQNCFWWAIKTYFLFEPELPVYVLRCYNCIIDSAPFWKLWTLSQPVRTLNWAYGECRLNKSEHVDKQPDHFWKTAWKAPVLMPPFRGYKQPCLLYQMGHALNRTVNPGLVILLTDLNIMD